MNFFFSDSAPLTAVLIIPAVAAAVARYRKAVTDLEAQARAELDTLVAQVQARRAEGRS